MVEKIFGFVRKAFEYATRRVVFQMNRAKPHIKASI